MRGRHALHRPPTLAVPHRHGAREFPVAKAAREPFAPSEIEREGGERCDAHARAARRRTPAGVEAHSAGGGTRGGGGAGGERAGDGDLGEG